MKVQSTKQVQTCPNIEPREKKKEYQPKCIMQTEANNKKTDENWEKNGEVQVRHHFFNMFLWVGFYIPIIFSNLLGLFRILLLCVLRVDKIFI